MIIAVIAFRAIFMDKLPKKTFVYLWIVTAIVLLTPIQIKSPVSVFNLPDKIQSSQIESQPTEIDYSRVTEATVIYPLNNIHSETDSNDFTEVRKPDTETDPETPKAKINPVPYIVFTVWICGAVGCAAWFLFSYRKWKREFSASLPCFDEFVCEQIKQMKISRKIRVLVSEKIVSPLTYGLFRPVILLPKNMPYDEIYLTCILTHEYIHIKNFDTVKKFLFALCMCVHWFNPLVWLMVICSNRDIEISCDEEVIEKIGENMKKTYSLALLEAYDSQKIIMFSGFSRYALKERICSVMKYRKNTILSVVLAFGIIIGTVSVFGSAKVNNNPARIDEETETEQTSATADEDLFLKGESEEEKAKLALEKAITNYEKRLAEAKEAEMHARIAAEKKTLAAAYDSITGNQDAPGIFQNAIQHQLAQLEQIHMIVSNWADDIELYAAEKVVYEAEIESKKEQLEEGNQKLALTSLSDEKCNLLTKMLTSTNYFNEASGVFYYTDKVVSQKSVFSLIVDDGSGNSEYFDYATDNGYTCLNIGFDSSSRRFCSSSGDYPERLKSRTLLQKISGYGVVDTEMNPIAIGISKCALLPEEIVLDFLYENDNWTITRETDLFDRACTVIEGTLGGKISEKLNIESFTISVDKKTGVVLYLQGFDSKGEISLKLGFDEFKYEHEAWKMDVRQIGEDINQIGKISPYGDGIANYIKSLNP